MEHKEYLEQLAQLVAPAERQELFGNDDLPTASTEQVPLNSFFGDDFLTLIYLNGAACSLELENVRENLNIVSSKGAKHVKAQAAFELGRFVRYRSQTDEYRPGSSSPLQWFELARQWNNVVAAAEVAKTLLARNKQRVEFDLDLDPMPKLVAFGESNSKYSPWVDACIADAWYLGARVCLRHIQRGFTGWGEKELKCALSCIVNYLALPQARAVFGSLAPLEQRREALVWIKPLWNKLITFSATLQEDEVAGKVYRDSLVEQQLAVLLYLEQDEPEEQVVRKSAKGSPPEKPKQSRPPKDNEIVIISGVIPPATDRSDVEYLKRYEALREPIVFQEFPSLASLHALHDTLRAEFPWAQAAISIVMSDLMARKRHGAKRLGMAPVLLVGPPGTGKTRFAQRLSELLGTPNTVINLAGMTDVKTLKGVTRGWASNRPSRMLEFMLQTKVPNPLFILDEIDKAHSGYSSGGDPQEALLDLLEPGNARRYQDVFLMTECNLSHCLYVATSNSLCALSEPLLSRLRPVLFPAPGPEHTEVILKGIVRDLEQAWGLPQGAIFVSARQAQLMTGLSAREIRRALLEELGSNSEANLYAQH